MKIKPTLTIGRKLTIGALVGVLFVMLAMLIVSSTMMKRSFLRSYQEKVKADMKNIVNYRLQEMVNMASNYIHFLSADSSMVQSTYYATEVGSTEDLATLAERLNARLGLSFIEVIGPDGKIVQSTLAGRVGQDLAKSPEVESARGGGQFLRFEFSDDLKNYVIHAAETVTRNDKAIGIVHGGFIMDAALLKKLAVDVQIAIYRPDGTLTAGTHPFDIDRDFPTGIFRRVSSACRENIDSAGCADLQFDSSEKDFGKTPHLLVATPIRLTSPHPVATLIIAKEATQIQRDITRSRNVFLVAIVFCSIAAWLLIVAISRPVTRRILDMAEFANKISIGHFPEKIRDQSGDEIAALSVSLGQMLDFFVSIMKQAKTIAQGDYSVEIVPRSERDELGVALSNMTGTLRRVTSENEKQTWLKTGQTELNDRMRGEQDIPDLAREIVGYLAPHLKTPIGAVYLANQDKSLALVGSYGYSKRKNLSNEFGWGEGLVGQAALEKQCIVVNQIPDDYIKITSGLGEAPPRSICVMPFLYDNEVKGVVEVGSFDPLAEIQLEFLRQVAPNIAIALNSAQSRVRTRNLLEQTQKQAEELQAQQEELKQANEELEQQSQALRESEGRLQTQQEELKQANEELEERTHELERQKEQIRKKNVELEGASRKIEAKAKELELASKYKSEFLANMSHELRTPLNSMLILSKVLFENKENNLNEKQVQFARTIHSAGSDLLSLINEILDLSKVEAGKMEIQVETVALKDFCDSTERTFQHLAEDRKLYFKTEVSDGLRPEIRTDRQRLEQIVKNLLSNAFKFTRKGGVTLSIRRPDAGVPLEQSGLDPSRAIAFAVTDTGIGIPEGKLKQIFEAFQQADGTTSRQYGGTGLGLTISSKFAELLGGEIQVQSRQGEGSTFMLILPEERSGNPEPTEAEEKPRRPAATGSTTEPASPPDTEAVASGFTTVDTAVIRDDRRDILPGDRSVLIVEDDPNFASIVCNLAHEKGFKFLVAENGETGLQFAEYYKPSAIILDIRLPGIDGWTVMKRLKENADTRHIPVHFISALDENLQAMRMGAIGYLKKPVTMEQLEAAFTKLDATVSGRIKKLLVVEDDESSRKSLVELLGGEEVAITAVGMGEEAYNLLKSDQFDCMVLDLGLPDISGFELLERIKAEKTVSHIPIIIYTARELSKGEEEKLKEYAESIIIKGVKSPERLLDETALFLHLVQSNLPEEKQRMIRMVHDKDSILKDKKILVVDDDMRNVFALTGILEQYGMKVLVGRNGREGLDGLNKASDVSLVLMDIMMPEMDGYEAMRRIRQEPTFKKLPIIALTAKAMKGDRDKCIEAGANDYLSKPIDTDRLLSLLRVWLYP